MSPFLKIRILNVAKFSNIEVRAPPSLFLDVRSHVARDQSAHFIAAYAPGNPAPGRALLTCNREWRMITTTFSRLRTHHRRRLASQAPVNGALRSGIQYVACVTDGGIHGWISIAPPLPRSPDPWIPPVPWSPDPTLASAPPAHQRQPHVFPFHESSHFNLSLPSTSESDTPVLSRPPLPTICVPRI
eukprot:874921-Prorocentrum_minimum.AAC.2